MTVNNAEISSLLCLDTASVSDALDSLNIDGALLGIKPAVGGKKCAGPAYTVQYSLADQSSTFRNAANYIDDVPAGSVIVSTTGGRTDCTIWGDILTQFAARAGIAGTVLDGCARDIETVRSLSYPLFCRDIYMRSGKNRVQLSAVQVPISVSGIPISPQDIIFCDENGCVVIPQDVLSEVVSRADAVSRTESSIVHEIYRGSSLAAARKIHRYDQPWLSADRK